MRDYASAGVAYRSLVLRAIALIQEGLELLATAVLGRGPTQVATKGKLLLVDVGCFGGPSGKGCLIEPNSCRSPADLR